MLVMRDETFGPVLPIMRVREIDEAVSLANQTSYGVAANPWAQDKCKGVSIAKRLVAGSVCINDMIKKDAGMQRLIRILFRSPLGKGLS